MTCHTPNLFFKGAEGEGIWGSGCCESTATSYQSAGITVLDLTWNVMLGCRTMCMWALDVKQDWPNCNSDKALDRAL